MDTTEEVIGVSRDGSINQQTNALQTNSKERSVSISMKDGSVSTKEGSSEPGEDTSLRPHIVFNQSLTLNPHPNVPTAAAVSQPQPPQPPPLQQQPSTPRLQSPHQPMPPIPMPPAQPPLHPSQRSTPVAHFSVHANATTTSSTATLLQKREVSTESGSSTKSLAPKDPTSQYNLDASFLDKNQHPGAALCDAFCKLVTSRKWLRSDSPRTVSEGGSTLHRSPEKEGDGELTAEPSLAQPLPDFQKPDSSHAMAGFPTPTEVGRNIQVFPPEELVRLSTELYGMVYAFFNASPSLHGTLNLGVPTCVSMSTSLTSMPRHSVAEVERVVEAKPVPQQTGDQGEEHINNYSVIGELGMGRYGKVVLALDSQANDEPVAIKSIDKGHRIRGDSMVLHEIAVMKKLNHKNVVRLREVIHDSVEDVYHLVMDYVQNGPVVKQNSDGSWPCLDERVVKYYIRQAATGLQYLHKHNIAHNDIKPENMLIRRDNTLVLVDFGVSAMLDFPKTDPALHTACGTLAFYSPEKCSSKEPTSANLVENAKTSDVWALGVCMYLMLFGRLPFRGVNDQQLIHAITHARLTFPDSSDMQVQEVLLGLLEKNPLRRWSLHKLRNHPYFLDAGAQFSTPAEERVAVMGEPTKEEIESAVETRHVVLRRSESVVSQKCKSRLHNFVGRIRECVKQSKLQRRRSGSFQLRNRMVPRDDSMNNCPPPQHQDTLPPGTPRSSIGSSRRATANPPNVAVKRGMSNVVVVHSSSMIASSGVNSQNDVSQDDAPSVHKA